MTDTAARKKFEELSKRGGFAGALGLFTVARRILGLGKHESPTAKEKSAKPPKKRTATILSSVSTEEAKSASVRRPKLRSQRGGVRRASLLSNINKSDRLG